MSSKFKPGDLVNVLKPHGGFLFTGRAVIIAATPPCEFSGSGPTYGIYGEGAGEMYWFRDEDDFELISHDNEKLLEEWKLRDAEDDLQKSDLDWIFSHAEEFSRNPKGASIQALASCFGLNNLWGAAGEGFTWHQNAGLTMRLAYPFLVIKDKDAWLAACEKIKVEFLKPRNSQS